MDQNGRRCWRDACEIIVALRLDFLILAGSIKYLVQSLQQPGTEFVRHVREELSCALARGITRMYCRALSNGLLLLVGARIEEGSWE